MSQNYISHFEIQKTIVLFGSNYQQQGKTLVVVRCSTFLAEQYAHIILLRKDYYGRILFIDIRTDICLNKL